MLHVRVCCFTPVRSVCTSDGWYVADKAVHIVLLVGQPTCLHSSYNSSCNEFARFMCSTMKVGQNMSYINADVW